MGIALNSKGETFVTARAFIISAIGAILLLGAAAAAYFFLFKNDKTADAKTGADPASIEGVDVEDALNVETAPADIPGGAEGEAVDQMSDEGGVEGDPWLDPEAVEGGEAIEGSGDFVEEEPFEDVFDPASGGYSGSGSARPDPIDPSEMPAKDAPSEEPAATAEPAEPAAAAKIQPEPTPQ